MDIKFSIFFPVLHENFQLRRHSCSIYYPSNVHNHSKYIYGLHSMASGRSAENYDNTQKVSEYKYGGANKVCCLCLCR